MRRNVAARSGVRSLLIVAFFWLLIAAVLALGFWPDLPQSRRQLVLLVVFGPPAYVFGESLFGWLFSRRHGQSISTRTFAFRRVIVALPAVAVLVALSLWFSWLLTRSA
jgi:hypothetical protein